MPPKLKFTVPFPIPVLSARRTTGAPVVLLLVMAALILMSLYALSVRDPVLLQVTAALTLMSPVCDA